MDCLSLRGVHTVHYLIFSHNLMVRRAATEALCNMAQHDVFLKVSYALCVNAYLRRFLLLLSLASS
jgi:hypothetical protein